MSVPVCERIVHPLEVEGIDALFGIPDPGFIHKVVAAEAFRERYRIRRNRRHGGAIALLGAIGRE